MVPIIWKFPTKQWFLRGCLILGRRDYSGNKRDLMEIRTDLISFFRDLKQEKS
jgi:hypothetical protein